MRLSANISMLFPELPMARRFEAAAAAGFECVEIQFPDEEDTDALAVARRAAGIPVDLINIPRGGSDASGLAALPGREADFAAAVETALRGAEALGAAKVNALAGDPGDADPARCRETLAANLALAAERFAGIGVRVMTEPVNALDRPGFFLIGVEAGLETLDRVGHPNLGLQFDLYHMAITEPDLVAAIERAGLRIGHAQFADAPGRGAPGTGATDFGAALAALRGTSYDGALAAEYLPRGDTGKELSWMDGFREAMW